MTGPKIVIVTDASPWGLGAWIKVDDKILEYWSSPVTQCDADILDIEIGSCRCQQVVEALAILIALRTWKDMWKHSRVVLTVRADNVSALTLLAYMKARRGPMATVAREVALDVADGVYTPTLSEHIPGVTNEAADGLSRRHQPNKIFVRHSLLNDAKEIQTATRNRSWWRSLAA